MNTTEARPSRTLPWWVLVLIVAGYSIILTVTDKILPFDFDKVTYDANQTFIAASHIAVCAVYVTAIAYLLGWWSDVWKDHVRMRTWMWYLPVGMFIIAFFQANYRGIAALGGLKYAAAVATLVLLVGYSEEMLVRGILLVGFRKFVAERWAFLFSVGLFGLMHYGNMIGGQSFIDSTVQCFGAMLLGTGLYATRRLSGGLLFPILLHAFWDGGSNLMTGSTHVGVPNFTIFALISGIGVLALYPLELSGFVLIMLGISEPKQPKTA